MKASFNSTSPAAGLTSQDLEKSRNDHEKAVLAQLMLDKTENERKLDMKVKRLGDSLSRINNSYKNADKPLQ